ncbi:hypothetical protein BGZ76_009951 [Entomortierella beljakovae]|nr:hypothetical protein BGZ76_009951 [Entomortierella beljakovae]
MLHISILLLSVAVVYGAPTLVIDYNCTPNIACGVMTSALANKGIGLAGINDIEITSTQPLRRTGIKYTCPIKYCQGLKDPAPGSNNVCFEYPFSNTVITINMIPRIYSVLIILSILAMLMSVTNAQEGNIEQREGIMDFFKNLYERAKVLENDVNAPPSENFAEDTAENVDLNPNYNLLLKEEL